MVIFHSYLVDKSRLSTWITIHHVTTYPEIMIMNNYQLPNGYFCKYRCLVNHISTCVATFSSPECPQKVNLFLLVGKYVLSFIFIYIRLPSKYQKINVLNYNRSIYSKLMLIIRTVSNISNVCLAELLVGLMDSLMENIITPKIRHVVKLYWLVVDQPLWKILVRLDHHPNYWGKKVMFQTTTQLNKKKTCRNTSDL